MTPEALDMRLEEWARWCQHGGVGAGLWWKRHAAGLNDVVKSAGGQALSPTADRECDVEIAVAALAQIDNIAAEVIRAEYHAAPRFGSPDYDTVTEHRRKECRKIQISERTYRSKLQLARTAVATHLQAGVLAA